MNNKFLPRVVSLLILLALLFPVNHASALATPQLPPVDMFQLPWDQGLAWFAVDGFDNGSKRPASSSHNYRLGGAIDFAPRNTMFTGEDTSNFWVTAAAAGIVVETSNCHLGIAHDGGWITQYLFLGNIQVNLGDTVARNQRLGVIADGIRYRYCTGYLEPNTPHLHFMLRPTMIGATFAGWQFNYNPLFNRTTFTKGLITVGLFKPLLNVPIVPPTPSPTLTTPTPTATSTELTATVPPSQTPTATAPSGPYVSTIVNATSIQIDETTLATVSLNNVPAEGYTSAEFTCTYDQNLVEAGNIVVGSLFGADPANAVNGPQNGSFIVAIAGSNGNKATTSGAVFTFSAKGLQAGQTALECTARVSTGNNVLTDLPSIGTSLTIVDLIPTATGTETPTPIESVTPAATQTSTPDLPPPPSATATPVIPGDWLTFTNSKYGFEFKYPPQGQIVAGNTDNFARINLPFAPGTNLGEKYLQVDVVENANPCRSPVAASSFVQSSETVMLNGITFLKETGQEPAAGNLYQFVAYSTARDNACVSLSFVLHSVNPGNLATPIPVFDYAAESAVFEQVVSTYAWLALPPTSTPTSTESTPVASPTPTATLTSTPVESPTATLPPSTSGTLAGQVLSSEPVAVSLYDATDTLITSVTANVDGTFSLTAPAGAYTVRATATGFLNAEGPATLTGGSTTTMPTITLLAGDIDNNNVINQFDALTIGMNYNASAPSAADLNNDGIINVLDLELLAQNYRETGPVVWE